MPKITVELPDKAIKELEVISVLENIYDQSKTINYLIDKYRKINNFKPTDGVF